MSCNQEVDAITSAGYTNRSLTNDSPASLLARRVMGIIGTIDHEMLTKERDSHKYFTENRMHYEGNHESNRLEYLIPKKTSLRHRLPMGDQGFTDFVAHLLEINPKKRPSALEALKHPWACDGSGIRAILRYPDPNPYPDPGFSDIRMSDIFLKIIICGGYLDPDLDP
ncbi:hypothetical protein YC2023_023187 [Brassica napus]